MNDIKVGLLGYGYAGQTFHAPLIAAVAGLRLTQVYSSRPDRVHADWPDVTVCASVGAMLESDVELIVVASPNEHHLTHGLAALRAGKHVVIDKPMAATRREAIELAEVAEHEGRLLMVFHNRRWDADFLTLERLLREGAVGEAVALESRFDRFRPLVRDRWREQPGPGSGLWLDLGPHLVDQACRLFGSPATIYADLGCQRREARATDYFHVILGYEDGRRRTILHASALVAAETPRFALHGTAGSYVKYGLDPQEAALKEGQLCRADPRCGVLTTGEEAREIENLPGDYRAFYAGAVGAIRGGPSPVPVEEALRVMELLELGARSHEQGRMLRVTAGAL